MEFQYRAIDERRRSRSPPPPAAPSTPASGSADSHRVGNSAAAAVDADELRRQAEKQMLHGPWPALGRSARGSDTPAALSTEAITAANSSLPVALETHPKSNAPATVPTKRKSPDCATGALLVPSIKKQKSTLICMVCCITANSEKAMQDHLNGKVHKRKVVALPELPKLVPEKERRLEPGEEEAMAMESFGDYKPTVTPWC